MILSTYAGNEGALPSIFENPHGIRFYVKVNCQNTQNIDRRNVNYA